MTSEVNIIEKMSEFVFFKPTQERQIAIKNDVPSNPRPNFCQAICWNGDSTGMSHCYC
jgi:hypothetical protein